MEELERALEKSTEEIQAALVGAEAEMAELEQRLIALRAVIGRARAVVGYGSEAANRDLTLHEALGVVLADSDQDWMSVNDLAGEVNRRNLYRMRDGRPLEPGQVHARVNNYKSLFEKQGSEVRLRYRFSTSPGPTTGAFWVAFTDIVRVEDGERMQLETRLAYSVGPPQGATAEQYVLSLAGDRARRLVDEGKFIPGAADVALFTTVGWQQISSTNDGD